LFNGVKNKVLLCNGEAKFWFEHTIFISETFLTILISDQWKNVTNGPKQLL
jgi:hypothetical protein